MPQFEPNLKAGGSWDATLTVPEDIRDTAHSYSEQPTGERGESPSFTWIIEISSQVIFSVSAAVHFELLVGRDQRSVELGFASLAGNPRGAPGKVHDHQLGKRVKSGKGAAQPKGVYSKAIDIVVDDTASLWESPGFPSAEDAREHVKEGDRKSRNREGSRGQKRDLEADERGAGKPKKKKKVHLVILTHGLHSNLGGDMLYLKESIDKAAKQAREHVRKRREKYKQREQRTESSSDSADDGQQDNQLENTSSQQNEKSQASAQNLGNAQQEDLEDDDVDEQVVVRGFSGNAVRTERGIQYLGKRLAKYVLKLTYPSQPVMPVKSTMKDRLTRSLSAMDQSTEQRKAPVHEHSSLFEDLEVHGSGNLPYEITSISFIGHSLGGLTQTYAVAYIQKHSPQFFDRIKPINFIGMASPFLGLSNENPMYVKFALDFGLVGRTGQDLGLTWRAPTVVRSGWGAMIGGLGNEAQKGRKDPDPASKPLLRILPTGPAHQVLKRFRNRTVYSNVVNDGIVPLRTSCLLFLDWRGLGRVEKARREYGLVGTMAEWGWSEITGTNASGRQSHRQLNGSPFSDSGEDSEGLSRQEDVPQPSSVTNDPEDSQKINDRTPSQLFTEPQEAFQDEEYATRAKDSSAQQPAHPLAGFLSFFRNKEEKDTSHRHSPKHTKIYKRSQTVQLGQESPSDSDADQHHRPGAVRGDSLFEASDDVFAPPKTTFFESAGDLLNPPLPPVEYLTDPAARPRTIFHDRVYHPEDIPPPPTKRPNGLVRKFSSNSIRNQGKAQDLEPDQGGMKIEEKIARAYHKDLSWRKVLVRLEPDAHNNMVVRRMFSNAYGWPVIKHLCDTHFADTLAARTEDTLESNEERANPMGMAAGKHGEEVQGQSQDPPQRANDANEARESSDILTDLKSPAESSLSSSSGPSRLYPNSEASGEWSDRFFDVSDDSDDMESVVVPMEAENDDGIETPKGTSEAEIADFLSASPKKSDEEATRPPVTPTQIIDSSSPKSHNGNPEGRDTSAVGLGLNLGKKADGQVARPETKDKKEDSS